MQRQQTRNNYNHFFQSEPPVDDAYSRLFREGEVILLRIDTLSRMIECKRAAEDAGKEAHFYQNPYVCDFQVLREPLAHYEAEMATLIQRRDEIKNKLSWILNARDTSADLRKSM